MSTLLQNSAVLYALEILAIFAGGVAYIALDTVRLLIVSRGHRLMASLLGVVEVVVFLLAVSRVLAGELDGYKVAAYALGFASGTWLGAYIEERMAVGMVLARLITQRDCGALLQALGDEGFGATNVAARGHLGRRRIVFSVLKRKKLHRFLEVVDTYHPNAFVAVEDVRSVRDAKEIDVAEIAG